MNIFKREMKANRKSLIIWCVGMVLLIASSMGKFAGMSSSGQSMNELIANMPKSLQAFLGAGAFDLSTASGYYGSIFLYLLVMAAIHATMLGANIISKEERDKTSEFLFVKPISRSKIITSKLIAALVNILVFNVITLVTSLLLVEKYSGGEEVTSDIFLLMTGLFMLQLLFLLLGSAIAAISKNIKKAASLSTGLMLLAFILSIAIDLNERLEGLKYFTPFKYFEAKNVMYGGGLDALFVAISVGLMAVFLSLTFIFYKKRDLNV